MLNRNPGNECAREYTWMQKQCRGRYHMARTVGIGHQDFEQVITKNIFYVDKTDFIREWWENEDAVTLIKA